MEGKPGKGGGGGKKAGLAPFASLEDLSDESPPDDKCRLTLPGIKEDQPAPAGSGQRPSITPRIDISRASSSSHHDDSSPERELFAEGTSGAKIGLGFTEEMAAELRSSTEELDFQDPEEETKTRRKKLHQQHAVGFIHVTKYELEAQSEKEARERKDSACSEGGLLFIGGRTSRLSSVGSVASGNSVASHVSGGSGVSGHSHLSAASRVSGQSHLSAVSNYSRASRCSSPHRMLLETSFCGPKPIPTLSLEAEYPPNESVEATLLARTTDITGAVLPPEEAIKTPTVTKAFSGKASLNVRAAKTLDVKTKPRSASERISKPPTHHVQPRSSSAKANLKSRPSKKKDEDALVRIIPLHGSVDEPEPEEEPEEEKPEQSDSTSYTPDYGIYIPLKGPIIDYSKTEEAKTPLKKSEPEKPKKPEIEESDLVRFISLHGDDDEEIQREKTDKTKQNSFRNGQNVQFKPWTDEAYGSQKSRSPEPMSSSDKTKKDTRNKSMFTTLFKKNAKETPLPQKRAQEKPLDPKITNVEFKFKQENLDSIIIPLHSPDSVTEPLMKYDPEAISVVEESEAKPKRPERKEYYEKKSPTMPLSENHISGKSIVVVDVSKEDRKEQKEIPDKTAQEINSKIARLELEDLEYEPRVRRSISHQREEEKIEEDNVFEEIRQEIIETSIVQESQVEEVYIEPKKSKTPMESLVISPSEEKPLLEEMISDRSPEEEVEEMKEAEERMSSESEVEQIPEKPKEEECDEERKGLFLQNDSVEEELPYVPTTLPQERSVAVPIVPIKQRVSEIKTIPVDRPRSTTPIQPSNLDEYAATHDGSKPTKSEKMQITLPRTDSVGRSKSPGRPKPWTQFAGECLSPKETRKAKESSNEAPPLPPKTGASSQWVLFDEQPEKRRAPKRITTLPIRPHQSTYSYVNPEECSCECHESQGKTSAQCLTESEQCSLKKGNRTDKEKRYRT